VPRAFLSVSGIPSTFADDRRHGSREAAGHLKAIAPVRRHGEPPDRAAWLDRCFAGATGVPHMATAGSGKFARTTSINR